MGALIVRRKAAFTCMHVKRAVSILGKEVRLCRWVHGLDFKSLNCGDVSSFVRCLI